jgi:ribosomal protein L35AE/L33A
MNDEYWTGTCADFNQRAKRNTNPDTSLIQIEGVGSKEEARYVLKLMNVEFNKC